MCFVTQVDKNLREYFTFLDIFPFYEKNGIMTKNTWFKTHRQDSEFPAHYLKPLATLGKRHFSCLISFTALRRRKAFARKVDSLLSFFVEGLLTATLDLVSDCRAWL